MKQPPYTTAPLIGGGKRAGLKELLLGQSASEAYYEAHRDDNGVYILWMEFSRFGTLRAYPCVVAEKDEAPLFFASGSDCGEGNDAMFARWQELVTPEEFAARFRWGRLDKKTFQEIFRAYRDGTA